MERRDRAAGESSRISDCILEEMWQEARTKGASLSFRVVSGSMSPLIKAGDLVRIARIEPSRIAIGDVVAVQEGQEVVVHRIIARRWSGEDLLFCHRGDAGVGSRTVSAQDLIGRAYSVERGQQQIRLDSRRQIIGSRLLGWLLRLDDRFRRSGYGHTSRVLRLALKPWLKLCRGVLLRRYWG